MPVTVQSSDHAAESWSRDQSYRFTQVESPEQLLRSILSDDRNVGAGSYYSAPPPRARQLIQSSFTNSIRPSSAKPDDNSPVTFATKNGLVHTCIEAYNNHHDLVLRPEDVWFAILSQLGAHLNADNSACRNLLQDDVVETGSAKKSLHIDVELTDDLDHGAMAMQMTKLLASHLRDPKLRDWFLPAFTTTERSDQAVAAILLMGAAQRFFTYSWGTRCGIPHVTLLGEADDWALMRARCADRLGGGHFGPAAAEWHRRVLAPVLDGFLESFREPEGRQTKAFWQGVCCEDKPNGSGVTEYSGWVTAFCYWNEAGQCLHDEDGGARIARGSVPMGFSVVPVVLRDNGTPIQTEMVAGSVGMRVMRSAEPTDGEGMTKSDGKQRKLATNDRWHAYDILQPESGWFLYRI